jgi:alpha-ketoglutarate-dependent taurine dioxygenase
MKISKIPGLGRFGTFIDDIDFDHLSDEEWMEIGKIHLNSLVTIIRNVNLDPELYPTWMEKWGKSRYSFRAHLEKKYNKTVGEMWADVENGTSIIEEREKNLLRFGMHTWMPTKNGIGMQRVQGGYDENGYPLGWFPEGELSWHSNEPAVPTFVPGISLYGQTKMVGSATGFLTTVDWYERQSESFRSELDEMVALHRFGHEECIPGMNNKIILDSLQVIGYPDFDHEMPLILESPGGFKGLHCFPGSAYAIKGMSQADSNRLFQRIYSEIFVDEYCYDHWYQQDNDICVFDNSVTLHRRIGSPNGRLAYRMAFDYTNLQPGPWMPYKNHGKYARNYIKEIHEQVKIQAIADFKLPGIKEYMKTFFY